MLYLSGNNPIGSKVDMINGLIIHPLENLVVFYECKRSESLVRKLSSRIRKMQLALHKIINKADQQLLNDFHIVTTKILPIKYSLGGYFEINLALLGNVSVLNS